MSDLDFSRAVWRKSAHSGANQNCVEVAAIWRKGSRSDGNGSCVEVARNLPGVVAVRDSKDRQGPKLAFTPGDWRRFAAQVKSGTFDAA